VAGDHLGHGFNLFYTRAFLVSMKQKLLQKLKRFPKLVDREAMLRSSTLREFDDVVTAPLHGFKNTDDYWTRASSKRLLTNIRVPTLLIHAKNDPFLPASTLPSPAEVSALVTLDYPDTGGHASFVSGVFPGHLNWLPQRILEFFDYSN